MTNTLKFNGIEECVGTLSCATPVKLPNSSPVYLSMVTSPTFIEFGAPVAMVDPLVLGTDFTPYDPDVNIGPIGPLWGAW